jgi:hypothetical protein
MYCWVILEVDAVVGPEAAVLGRDHRVLDVLRHLVVGDGVAVLHRVAPDLVALAVAVVVVDVRRLGLELGVGVRQVGGLVEERERAGPQQDQHQERHERVEEPPPHLLPEGPLLLGLARLLLRRARRAAARGTGRSRRCLPLACHDARGYRPPPQPPIL